MNARNETRVAELTRAITLAEGELSNARSAFAALPRSASEYDKGKLENRIVAMAAIVEAWRGALQKLGGAAAHLPIGSSAETVGTSNPDEEMRPS